MTITMTEASGAHKGPILHQQMGRINLAMRVLVIEDDKEAADYLVKGLRESGYTVDHAGDGRDGLFLALSESYDIMIVDRMLPGPDGISIVESVRKANITTPVLFLSALSEVEDRVAGLKVGGDDYLAKPFSFSELLARIEALLTGKINLVEREKRKPSGIE